jgi:hypothetical protein
MNEKLKKIKDKYEISETYIQQFQNLSSYKIAFVLDDSSTMTSTIENSRLQNGFTRPRRWDELLEYTICAIDLANLYNINGVDCYFLNRDSVKQVKNGENIKPSFTGEPIGQSPILDKFDQILKDNETYYKGQDGKLLITIVADGPSTDTKGIVNIKRLKEAIKDLHRNIRVRIVSITDDHTSMEFLDDWEEYFNNATEDKNGFLSRIGNRTNNNRPVDRILKFCFTDHFNDVKRNMTIIDGRFSFGDYVVKSLIGQFVTQPLSKSPSISSVVKKV